MSTLVRPNISTRSKYYISRHRFYELKHYCLQYPEWQKERLTCLRSVSGSVIRPSKSSANPTEDMAVKIASYSQKMKDVEDAVEEADSELAPWIMKAVAYGITFTALQTLYGIPCSRDTFYDRYRKFFYLLSLRRE